MTLCLIIAASSLAACAPDDKPSNDKLPTLPPYGDTEIGGNTDNETGGNNNNNNTDDDNNTGDGKGAQITFAAGGGEFANGNDSVVINADSSGTVEINSEPVLDGHAFAGWFNGDIEFDPESKYDASCTFTARYKSGSDISVYTALFAESSTVNIKLNMSDAEWKKLNNDYVIFAQRGSKSPIYRMADSVIINVNGLNYYYEEVGVRMKGNTSRHEFYGNDGFTDLVHLKLSFKQTFDDPEDGYTQNELKVWDSDEARKARKNRLFGDMEKIDIKYNSTKDETYVREMYAMKLFRDNGIEAPYVSLSNVTALEKDTQYKNLGLYRIHECVDEKFIWHHFGDTTAGDLWKCTYTSSGPADLTDYDLSRRIGVEDEMKGEFFSYDKKTNKKKDKVTGLRDFSSMINFIKAVNADNADYSALLDTDYFAKFEAINYVLGNPDCIRNNYNNYYLYFRPSDNKAIIIPYDYDRCIGITADWNPTGSANMYVQPYTRTAAATGSGQYNPLYKNLIDKGAPKGEGSTLLAYRGYLLEMKDSAMFTAKAFNAYKDLFKQRYSSLVIDNNHRFDNNFAGNVSYEQYITTKLDTLIRNIDNYNE